LISLVLNLCVLLPDSLFIDHFFFHCHFYLYLNLCGIICVFHCIFFIVCFNHMHFNKQFMNFNLFHRYFRCESLHKLDFFPRYYHPTIMYLLSPPPPVENCKDIDVLLPLNKFLTMILELKLAFSQDLLRVVCFKSTECFPAKTCTS
jgi:hypothetical protein